MDFTEVGLWHYTWMAALTVALVGFVALVIKTTTTSQKKKTPKKKTKK